METLQRTANRGSISTGYDIDNSLKFEHDNSEELNFTPSSNGSQREFTFSCWLKRAEVGRVTSIFGHYTNGSNQSLFRIDPDDKLEIRLVSGGTVREVHSTALLRDTSAWYHIVFAVKTDSASGDSDRLKAYVNGEEVTLSGSFPSNNWDAYGINVSGSVMDIGGITTATPTFYGLRGYLAEIHYIDGTRKAASDFGETDSDTGIWKPKEYDGTYGTNGAYLKFSNSGSLGEDSAGSNDWTLQNITSADQATDTPTNNFAIYNQLIPKDEFEIYQGATRAKKTTTNRWRTVASTLAVANGKWYAEFQNSLYSTTGTSRFVGVAPASIFTETSAASGGYLGGSSTETTDSIGYHSDNGQRYINGSGAAYGDSWTTDEIIGVALDMDNGYVYFSKNGTWQNSGDPTSGSSGTGGIALQLSDEAHYIAGSIFNSNAQLEVNYGGFTDISIASGNADSSGYGNFEYAPPSGYYALCSKNLAGKG